MSATVTEVELKANWWFTLPPGPFNYDAFWAPAIAARPELAAMHQFPPIPPIVKPTS